MTSKLIPVFEPLLDGNEARYVEECVRTGWVSSAGDYLERFESAWSSYCGVKRGVACSSGTAAMHLAFATLGIGAGDEVLVPDFNLIAATNMVIQTGARPVLVDVDRKTFCIDPELAAAKVTPRTRALLAVHMYGHPCDMDPLVALGARHGFPIIEDAAEAHGAVYKDRRVGSFGAINCFSFYGNKILTTGEGGMVTTDDDRLAARAARLRSQAFIEPRFVHREIGFNYRLTNVQAAIGLAQTEQIEKRLAHRRSYAEAYRRKLEPLGLVELPHEAPGTRNVHWVYAVLLPPGVPVAETQKRLRAEGVDTRRFFCPMHLQPVYREGHDPRYPDTSGSYPVSEELWERGLYLPSGFTLDEATIDRVVEALRRVLER